MRNTRTAAGFGHMPSKTHAEKVLHVTFGIHKTTIFCPLEQAEPLAEILEAQLRNTRTAAGFGHMPSKTHAEKVLHVTFGIHKTTIFCPLEQAKPLPWRRSCETLEQQQDSGTTFGIHKTTIFCPLEQAEPLAEIPWRRSCETLEQQQDSGTCQAKRTPKKCFTSPLESIKQQSFVLSSKQNHYQKSLGGAVAKHSNSSRIRAHAKQNARRKSASRHLWNP